MGLKILKCEPKEGTLTCEFDAGGIRIHTVAGVDSEGNATIISNQAARPVDPKLIDEAAKITLNSVKLKKDLYSGEFQG